MTKLKLKLKLKSKMFLCLLVVFSGLLLPSYSQEYYVTEEQLRQLETIINSQQLKLTEQEKLLQSAKSSTEILNEKLQQQATYCLQLEKNNKSSKIKTGILSASVGAVMGVLTGILIGVIKK